MYVDLEENHRVPFRGIAFNYAGILFRLEWLMRRDRDHKMIQLAQHQTESKQLNQ